MQRGVLIPPVGFERGKNGTSFFTYGDIPFLNIAPSAILYWDKVYAPIATRGMAPEYDAAVEEMLRLGVAESFDIKSVNAFHTGEIPAMIQRYSAEISLLNEREGQVWSVLPPCLPSASSVVSQTHPFLASSGGRMSSIEVQLKNALPVPDRSVPYEDLLDFKLKRQDQLNRLHTEVSSIASRYINNYEDQSAIELSLSDLRRSLAEVQQVYGEKWGAPLLRDLSFSFATNGLWPAGVTYLAGAEIDTAFFAGALATIIHSSVSGAFSEKYKSHPFGYAIAAANM
ncbi:hypothetical protein SAMN04488103_105296 [Gemmobacter aquatilis]|uniref:Uncharacterized protein n=1 Tax=Gemmobacter aquatilis TaxID=933059 RepID=A0A1H8HAT6_9RHOB|nr:DUF6236 family protein [Gemmobacter aquatilis]SEN53312.1 hypothetical protein SAMN04488103_105296 [Gemmobacter aquatilis]